MARFRNLVGFFTDGKLVGGVWKEDVVERPYGGKILNETLSSTESSEKYHEDVRLQSRVSIVADSYAFENIPQIKYVIDEDGDAWQVTSVEIKRPRLILSLGGLYNGRRPTP